MARAIMRRCCCVIVVCCRLDCLEFDWRVKCCSSEEKARSHSFFALPPKTKRHTPLFYFIDIIIMADAEVEIGHLRDKLNEDTEVRRRGCLAPSSLFIVVHRCSSSSSSSSVCLP